MLGAFGGAFDGETTISIPADDTVDHVVVEPAQVIVQTNVDAVAQLGEHLAQSAVRKAMMRAITSSTTGSHFITKSPAEGMVVMMRTPAKSRMCSTLRWTTRKLVDSERSFQNTQ